MSASNEEQDDGQRCRVAPQAVVLAMNIAGNLAGFTTFTQ